MSIVARRVEKSFKTSLERFELPQAVNAIAIMRAVARWIIDFIMSLIVFIYLSQRYKKIMILAIGICYVNFRFVTCIYR